MLPLSQMDVRTVLPTVRVPTLVLHHADDQVVLPAAGRYIADHIPGAKYVELPGRNMFHLVEPGWRASFQEIHAFLTGHQAAATVTACGVRLVLFARHRASTAAAIVVDWWLDQRRWHRQRWLRPECVEIFALSRPQPLPEEYLNET